MHLFRGNDSDLVSEVLKDAAGALITAGTVEAEILTEDGKTVLVAKGAMTHDAGGVWKRTIKAATITGFVVPSGYAQTRITVNDPPDATFVRVDEVVDRRTWRGGGATPG